METNWWGAIASGGPGGEYCGCRGAIPCGWELSQVEGAIAGGGEQSEVEVHHMAFAKTPKQIRIAILSVHFKIGLKCQVKKNQEFSNSCPTTLFCLNLKPSGIKPWSKAKLPTTLTNKPNTQVKKRYL